MNYEEELKKEFNLSEKIVIPINGNESYYSKRDVKEFIRRRLERIDLIIKLYPHKSGKELAGQLKEDLMNDAGSNLIENKSQDELEGELDLWRRN